MEVRVTPHVAVLPDGSQAHPGLYSIFVDNWHRGHVWMSSDPHIYLYQIYPELEQVQVVDSVERVLGDRRPLVLPPDLSSLGDEWSGVLPLDDEGVEDENGWEE